MNLPAPEYVLASAIQHLMDGGEDEAAKSLMSCSLALTGPIFLESKSVSSDRATQTVQFLATLTCSRLAYDALHQKGSVLGEAITSSLHAVLPDDYLVAIIQKDRNIARIPQLNLISRSALPDSSQQAKVRELLRTARRDVDLSGVEVKGGGIHVTLRPNVILPAGTFTRKKRLCFVVMPFAPTYDQVLGDGIKPAVESLSMNCVRADDIMRPGNVLKQIWQSLIEARVVIADITGNNGNVMYEVGLAHVIGHDVILLTRDTASAPFDLHQQRLLLYEPTGEGLRKLRRLLSKAIEEVVAATASDFT